MLKEWNWNSKFI